MHLSQSNLCLVNLHVGVDFPHKEGRADVADGAANQSERATKERHVAKIEDRLEQSVHPEGV